MLTNNCITAANYIIERTTRFNEENYSKRIFLTCKRIQKLLFLSYVEYAKRNDGNTMFEDNFFAWPSGPVIPSVFHKYLKYQHGGLDPIDVGGYYLTRAMQDALDYVLQRTWSLDEIDLIEIVCAKDGPWQRFYNDNDLKHEQIIPKCEIIAHYMKRSVLG